MVSVTPDLVYRDRDREMVEAVPIESLLVESDAPWQYQGEFENVTSGPWLVARVAEEVAKIKRLPVDEAMYQLTVNTCRVFDLDSRCLRGSPRRALTGKNFSHRSRPRVLLACGSVYHDGRTLGSAVMIPLAESLYRLANLVLAVSALGVAALIVRTIHRRVSRRVEPLGVVFALVFLGVGIVARPCACGPRRNERRCRGGRRLHPDRRRHGSPPSPSFTFLLLRRRYAVFIETAGLVREYESGVRCSRSARRRPWPRSTRSCAGSISSRASSSRWSATNCARR